MEQKSISLFSKKLIKWQKNHGRNNLPWQVSDPYLIWVSEIMLQQTQVKTVLDYYPRFIQRFPTVSDLAGAEEDDVLSLWSGLGYYSRARNLHYAARQIVYEFQNTFPSQPEELQKLKGIGRSTAAAISAFAYKKRAAILDGNVKRVLCRIFQQEGSPTDKAFENQLWRLAEQLLPKSQDIASYTQGLMDLGAMICTRSKPRCPQCPMNDICLALKNNLVKELPLKKKTQAVPVKSLYWLILYNTKHEILLHKRPGKGIWGGLYCVPSFESLDELENFCQNIGFSTNDCEHFEEIKHRLTHFLLLITPFQLTMHDRIRQPKGYSWYGENEAFNTGLPRPLQVFLT